MRKTLERVFLTVGFFILANLRLLSRRIPPMPLIQAPFLNCWACPAASMGCPIGSFQLLLACPLPFLRRIPFFPLGFLLGWFLIERASGRRVCSTICPIGAVQDLLFKIPSPKFRFPIPRIVPFVVFVVFVVVLPLFGIKGFCKYVCVVGTAEAGIPWVLTHRGADVDLSGFYLKASLLAIFVVGSIFVPRLWCRVACPVGLIYNALRRWKGV